MILIKKKKLLKLPLLLSTILVFSYYSVFAQSTNTNVKGCPSDIYGACLYVDGNATGVRMEKPFAMHSIMKFPQAIFVAEYLKKNSISLDETINDAGVIIMPNGTHQVIAVFAPQSIRESDVATIGKKYIHNK